jgi:hypothetical protein
MLTHAASGVEKGVRGSRKMPLEVLGMLDAHVDPQDEQCIVCVRMPSPLPLLPRTNPSRCPPAPLRTPLHPLPPTHPLSSVSDAFELDADGFEGSVEMSVSALEQQAVVSDISEKTRPGFSFRGWYHSHPFEVGTFPNYFLSNTDVISTKMQQRGFDNAGLPFVSLVLDPLTGAANGRPMIGAFRTFPDGFRPAVEGGRVKGPDGACARVAR